MKSLAVAFVLDEALFRPCAFGPVRSSPRLIIQQIPIGDFVDLPAPEIGTQITPDDGQVVLQVAWIASAQLNLFSERLFIQIARMSESRCLGGEAVLVAQQNFHVDLESNGTGGFFRAFSCAAGNPFALGRSHPAINFRAVSPVKEDDFAILHFGKNAHNSLDSVHILYKT